MNLPNWVCPKGELRAKLLAASCHAHMGLGTGQGEAGLTSCFPQSAFIFRDVRLRGFWMTQWKKDHAHGELRGAGTTTGYQRWPAGLGTTSHGTWPGKSNPLLPLQTRRA